MQKIIFLLVLAILSFSCKHEPESGYRIDVNIDGVADGKKVFLKKQENRVPVTIDTAVVKNGKFTFKGEIKEPLILGIFLEGEDKDGIFPFIDVNDKITVIANKDTLHKSKITGSKINDELTRLRKERDLLTKKSQSFLDEYRAAKKINDTVTINRINRDIRVIQDELAAKDWKYVKTHTNSFTSLLVFNSVMANPKYRDSSKIVFETFSDRLKNSDMAKPIVNYFKMISDKDEHKPSVKVTKPQNSSKK